jgi:hypothetical protein
MYVWLRLGYVRLCNLNLEENLAKYFGVVPNNKGCNSAVGAAIDQSIKRLAIGWTFLKSNRGGSAQIYLTRSDWPCRPPSLLYNR